VRVIGKAPAARAAGAREPEDVVQDTLAELTAGERWTVFDPDGPASVLTWLVSAVLWRVRRQYRQVPEAPPEAAPRVRLEHQRDIDARLDLEARVARLDSRQAQAVRLCYFGALTELEAARVMRCSAQAVHELLRQARKQLRKQQRRNIPWGRGSYITRVLDGVRV